MGMPSIVGVGASAASTGDITPPFPGGYSAVTDDIGLTFTECDSGDTLNAPSGWAVVTTSTVVSGTTTKLGAIWRHLVGGDTAPTIVDPGANNHMIGRMIIVRGCVTAGNPWDIIPASQENVADTSVSIPGGTTSVANCLCLAAFSTGQDTNSTAGATSWANASLANGAERMDNWTNAGNGGGFAMWSGEKAAAGTVDATTCTLSLTANFKALMMIALKGAPDPARPPIFNSQYGGRF